MTTTIRGKTCQVKRTYSESNVRLKDTQPERAEEIRTLCRQLTRLTAHFGEECKNVGMSRDGIMLRGAWTEDQAVDELRRLHKALTKKKG